MELSPPRQVRGWPSPSAVWCCSLPGLGLSGHSSALPATHPPESTPIYHKLVGDQPWPAEMAGHAVFQAFVPSAGRVNRAMPRPSGRAMPIPPGGNLIGKVFDAKGSRGGNGVSLFRSATVLTCPGCWRVGHNPHFHPCWLRQSNGSQAARFFWAIGFQWRSFSGMHQDGRCQAL